MGLLPPRGDAIQRLMGGLLDRGYEQATAPVMRAILNGSTSGVMAQRLADLDAEVARLVESGLTLKADNPVLRAALADFEQVINADAALISGAAGGVQQTGIDAAGQITRQLALPGLSDAELRVLGIAWNVPNPDAVAQVVNYTGSDAWASLLTGYRGDVVTAAQRSALNGIIAGRGPLQIARDFRRAVENVPAFQANTLMRTLQLTSYRDAAVIHRVANSDILAYQVRISALDDRACMACVALHGTRLPLDARIDDHWNGRCASITVLKGRAAPDIQSGEEWFRRRSPAQQQAQMGGAAYRAWSAGQVRLQDFVQHTSSDTFGPMVQQASLKGILGAQANQYYGQQQ